MGSSTTLRIYQYSIFNHSVLESCFEMLKSSEQRYDDDIQTNFLNCSKVN